MEAALGSLSRRLPANVAREDLASAGKLALVVALARCDRPAHEVRAYCFVRVRGAMLDELRRLDPLTRAQRVRTNAVERARHDFSQRQKRPPTLRELAVASGLPVATLRVLERAAEASAASEFEWSSLVDADAASPVESVENDDLRTQLRAALTRLPDNQALALRRYYLEDATLDDIASELRVSRERARQVREAGEKKLRADFVVLALWQSLLTRAQK